jgi:general secretion pathway protein E/type IV pilus assembly protein PilB
MGIYELMVTTDEIRQLAHDRASSWKIKQTAVDLGMHTLRVDGWQKVLRGETSVDEVLKATTGDQKVASYKPSA